MHDLEITWPGGRLRFTPDDSPVLIGRSSSAAVVVPQGTVSRRHLTMSWNGRSWQAEDTSTHGSFDPIGVRLAQSWTVGTNVVVRLGSPRGVELSMRLITKALDEQVRLDPHGDPDSPPTIVDFGPPPPPDPAAGTSGLLSVGDGDGGPRFRQDPIGAEPVELSELSGAGHGDRNPNTAGRPVALDDHGDRADDANGGDHVVIDLRPGTGAQPDSDGSDHGFDANQTTVAGAVDHHADSAHRTDGNRGHDADHGSVLVGADHQQADAMDWSHPPNQPLDLSVSAQPYGSGVFADNLEAPVLGEPAPDRSYSPAATFVENDTLRLQIDGEDFVFLPGHEVTIGRDPSCLVTVDERHSLVSRRHLRFVHAQGTWWLEDASSKGTYIHGRRLNRPYKAEGAFIAQLGDPTAGTQLRVVTAGQHRQPANRAGMAIAAIAAAALVIAAVVAWLVLRGDESQAEALATAKQSTVMLLSESGHGSGFFVSRSMIVTNQHVAAMADQLVVAVSPEVDEPAEIRYIATLVRNHPFLDIAVVRITNEASINDAGSVTIGNDADSADVPLLQLGDSGLVTIGDPVTSVGFPGRFSVPNSDDTGATRLAAVSSTSGQAANFTAWPGCNSPNLDSFIPPDSPATVACSADGAIEKGVLLTSFASGQGASGSAVLHDEKVVAVLFAGDAENATAGRSITTNAFSGWLSTVLAEAE